MTFLIKRAGIGPEAKPALERIETLVADLRRIVGGEAPTSEDLETAPLLDGWRMNWISRPCLYGEIHGHPVLRGPKIETSELWAFAPELGWARTMSRFYRLGRPYGKENAS